MSHFVVGPGLNRIRGRKRAAVTPMAESCAPEPPAALPLVIEPPTEPPVIVAPPIRTEAPRSAPVWVGRPCYRRARGGQPLLTVALPVYNSREIVWLSLEG